MSANIYVVSHLFCLGWGSGPLHATVNNRQGRQRWLHGNGINGEHGRGSHLPEIQNNPHTTTDTTLSWHTQWSWHNGWHGHNAHEDQWPRHDGQQTSTRTPNYSRWNWVSCKIISQLWCQRMLLTVDMETMSERRERVLFPADFFC